MIWCGTATAMPVTSAHHLVQCVRSASVIEAPLQMVAMRGMVIVSTVIAVNCFRYSLRAKGRRVQDRRRA